MRLPKRATIARNTNFTYKEWITAPLYDAREDIVLEITGADIVQGRPCTGSCPLVLSGKRVSDFIRVGVEAVNVGFILDGKPVLGRYRAGKFPTQYDISVSRMAENTNLSFADCGIKPKKYVLRAPTPSQTLEAKRKGGIVRMQKIKSGELIPQKRNVAQRKMYAFYRESLHKH